MNQSPGSFGMAYRYRHEAFAGELQHLRIRNQWHLLPKSTIEKEEEKKIKNPEAWRNVFERTFN
jgi:hypothetical protein